MKETDYIGKLVYEQYKKLEGKYDVLEKRNAELSEENTKMAKILAQIAGMVISHKREFDGQHYVDSFWREEADELCDLLGIEEEEDDTLSDQ